MGAITGIAAGALDQVSKAYAQWFGTSGTSSTSSSSAVNGSSFASLLSNGLTSLESSNAAAQTAAVGAATGDLTQVQDYVIAASKAQMATSLTTTLRNKALDAFTEIMRMSL